MYRVSHRSVKREEDWQVIRCIILKFEYFTVSEGKETYMFIEVVAWRTSVGDHTSISVSVRVKFRVQGIWLNF